VSHMFDMGSDWPPDASEDVNGLQIYRWTITAGEEQMKK